jgi:hypothetical protein
MPAMRSCDCGYRAHGAPLREAQIPETAVKFTL